MPLELNVIQIMFFSDERLTFRNMGRLSVEERVKFYNKNSALSTSRFFGFLSIWLCEESYLCSLPNLKQLKINIREIIAIIDIAGNMPKSY